MPLFTVGQINVIHYSEGTGGMRDHSAPCLSANDSSSSMANLEPFLFFICIWVFWLIFTLWVNLLCSLTRTRQSVFGHLICTQWCFDINNKVVTSKEATTTWSPRSFLSLESSPLQVLLKPVIRRQQWRKLPCFFNRTVNIKMPSSACFFVKHFSSWKRQNSIIIITCQCLWKLILMNTVNVVPRTCKTTWYSPWNLVASVLAYRVESIFCFKFDCCKRSEWPNLNWRCVFLDCQTTTVLWVLSLMFSSFEEMISYTSLWTHYFGDSAKMHSEAFTHVACQQHHCRHNVIQSICSQDVELHLNFNSIQPRRAIVLN